LHGDAGHLLLEQLFFQGSMLTTPQPNALRLLF
jgi:hypothetical protein